MKPSSIDFLHAAEVRRAVVPEGDIREDIAFQNDINGLLARLDGKNPPLTALGWVRKPLVSRPLHLVDGVGLRLVHGGRRAD